nr:hypothetical protein B7L51_02440 [Pectobacterium carotovorum]
MQSVWESEFHAPKSIDRDISTFVLAKQFVGLGMIRRNEGVSSALIHRECVTDGSEGGMGIEGTALAASFTQNPGFLRH